MTTPDGTEAIATGSRLRNSLGRLLGDRLMRNLGWYALSEMAQRLTRIATTVILALWLGAAEFGIAAIAITAFELIRVLANNGIGQTVVRASDASLAATVARAWRLAWIVCGVTAFIQIAAAVFLAHATGRDDVFAMVACLAGVYLLMPFGMVQSYLVQRENRIGALAVVATTQNVTDNFLTIVLALCGFGAWAIVLPKVLTAPIWVLGMRRAHAWRFDRAVVPAPALPVLRFAAPVLGAEILSAVRINIDKVLVGAVLGVEALGIYYFVFNAGIGLSMSLTSALSSSIYPHLAELRHAPRALIARYDQSVLRTVLPVSIVIALQALAAPLYVPFIFGDKWTAAAPLVAMLCASAITKPLYDATAQMVRAAGRPDLDFGGSLALTCITLAAFGTALPLGLNAGIAVLAATAFSLQACLAVAGRSMIARTADRSTAANEMPAAA